MYWRLHRWIGRRLYERVCDHGGKDKKSYMLKHSYEKCCANESIENFQIPGNEFSKNTFKWKLLEALFIKELCPSLNTQKNSVALRISN